MKKKNTFISCCALIFASAVICNAGFNTNTEQTKLSDIALANLEALAQNIYDHTSGSAQKIVNTYDSDPSYTMSPDEEKIVENTFVYTETTCYGSGIIQCEYDFKVNLVTRRL